MGRWTGKRFTEIISLHSDCGKSWEVDRQGLYGSGRGREMPCLESAGEGVVGGGERGCF